MDRSRSRWMLSERMRANYSGTWSRRDASPSLSRVKHFPRIESAASNSNGAAGLSPGSLAAIGISRQLTADGRRARPVSIYAVRESSLRGSATNERATWRRFVPREERKMVGTGRFELPIS